MRNGFFGFSHFYLRIPFFNCHFFLYIFSLYKISHMLSCTAFLMVFRATFFLAEFQLESRKAMKLTLHLGAF